MDNPVFTIHSESYYNTTMKYLILTSIILCAALKLAAQELPPDLQAGVDFAEKGPDKRLLEIMLDYRSVLEAELADLYTERDVLDKRLEVVDKSIRTHKILSWITIPLGTGGSGYGHILSCGIGGSLPELQKRRQL